MEHLNLIEIADSDEDLPSEVGETMDPKRCATPPTLSAAKARLANEHTPTTSKGAKGSASLVSDSTSPSSADTSPISAADAKTGRHRARKTQPQAKRMSPTDLQFVTIPEEDEAPPAKQQKMDKDAALQKDGVKASIGKLLASDEMQELVKRIARERVRCNFLLATYQLPDMNFALNTHLDTLCFQFRERIKQRKGKAASSATTTSASTSSTAATSKAAAKSIAKARQP